MAALNAMSKSSPRPLHCMFVQPAPFRRRRDT